MTALNAFRAQAADKYKGLELELDNGQSVTLKSVFNLTDEELAMFNRSQKRIQDLDDAEVTEVKTEFVSLLAGVATDRAAVAEALDKETLGVLQLIFEEYTGGMEEATKSKGDS